MAPYWEETAGNAEAETIGKVVEIPFRDAGIKVHARRVLEARNRVLFKNGSLKEGQTREGAELADIKLGGKSQEDVGASKRPRRANVTAAERRRCAHGCHGAP